MEQKMILGIVLVAAGLVLAVCGFVLLVHAIIVRGKSSHFVNQLSNFQDKSLCFLTQAFFFDDRKNFESKEEERYGCPEKT